jgi:hypothetical protein
VLVGTLLAGVLGSGAELLLLGHYETPFRMVPRVWLALGRGAVLWQIAAPRAASVRALRLVATLFLIDAVAGGGLHSDGHTAFALEMSPELRGLALRSGNM